LDSYIYQIFNTFYNGTVKKRIYHTE